MSLAPCMLRLVLVMSLLGTAAAGDPHLHSLREAKRVNPEACLEQLQFAPSGGPAGGYLYRFTLNVTGDDTPELFTASSVVYPNAWTVFSLDGNAQQAIGEIGLPPNGFYLQDEGSVSRLLTVLAGVDLRQMLVVQYRFTNGSIERVTKEVFPKDPERNPDGAFRSLLQMAEDRGYDVSNLVVPRIEKVLLQQYLTDQTTEWNEYVPSLINGWQHHDPKDKQAIENLTMTILQVFQAIPTE